MIVEQMLPTARERLVTIKNDALLIDAAILLSESNVNLLVVCGDADSMVGVITKTDVVRQIGHCKGSGCTAAIVSAMTKEVISCYANAHLRDVWAIMKERRFFNIPLISKESKPLGVINARDALLALLEGAEYEESLLRDYVMGIGYR